MHINMLKAIPGTKSAINNLSILQLMAQRILVGVPPKHHVLLSHDEIEGFNDLGYTCQSVIYGRN